MHPRQFEILTAVKARLKEKGITYATLADGLGVSILTIKRSLTIQGLSVDRLLEICEFMSVSLTDLISSAAKDPDSETYPLTLKEEDHFAENVLEYFFFLSLALTTSLTKSTQAFGFTEARAFGVARALEKRGFLKIMPKNKLHFPKGTMLVLNPNGKLSKRIGNTAQRDFWEGGHFNGKLSRSVLFQAALSDSSLIEINTEFQRFWDRIVQLGARDFKLSPDQLKETGITFGLRPFQYDPAAHYRMLMKS